MTPLGYLRSKWTSATLPQKAAVCLAFPILLLAALSWNALGALLEGMRRKDADRQDDKVEANQAAAAAQAAVVQGQIDELEEERKEERENASKEDPAAYVNDHYGKPAGG